MNTDDIMLLPISNLDFPPPSYERIFVIRRRIHIYASWFFIFPLCRHEEGLSGRDCTGSTDEGEEAHVLMKNIWSEGIAGVDGDWMYPYRHSEAGF